MRSGKKELVSNELQPFVAKIIKENRIKYNYSLEDLSKALGHKKNRQTLHKYETCMLNVPYDIFFEICRIFNIDADILKDIEISKGERELIEKKFVSNYVKSARNDIYLKEKDEKLLNTYKNIAYESLINKSELTMKVLDDSMSPYYLKNDKIFFKRQEEYKNGDDIIIAIKPNILSIRRLYRYQKGIILQAMNPKYPTMNINIISNEMILGKVVAIHREIN